MKLIVPWWYRPYIILCEWIEDRGRIPWAVGKLFRYAHFCDGMDGLFILRRSELGSCFCGLYGLEPDHMRAEQEKKFPIERIVW